MLLSLRGGAFSASLTLWCEGIFAGAQRTPITWGTSDGSGDRKCRPLLDAKAGGERRLWLTRRIQQRSRKRYHWGFERTVPTILEGRGLLARKNQVLEQMRCHLRGIAPKHHLVARLPGHWEEFQQCLEGDTEPPSNLSTSLVLPTFSRTSCCTTWGHLERARDWNRGFDFSFAISPSHNPCLSFLLLKKWPKPSHFPAPPDVTETSGSDHSSQAGKDHNSRKWVFSWRASRQLLLLKSGSAQDAKERIGKQRQWEERGKMKTATMY